MAIAVDFKGANCLLRAPPDNDGIGELPVFRNGVTSVSCWHLSPSEIDEITRTGHVYVAVLSGKQSQPPVFAGSETAVRGMTADYGVWKR